MNNWPSMLLLGATHRNAGKTHFSCKVIERLARVQPVVGLKVTVVRHESSGCPRGGEGCGTCGNLHQPFELSQELVRGADKDTQRMLAAGASEVWWLRVRRDSLEEGIAALREQIDPDMPLVCESNSLRLALVPGLFLMIHDENALPTKATACAVMPFADVLVLTDGRRHEPGPGEFEFDGGRWILPANSEVFNRRHTCHAGTPA